MRPFPVRRKLLRIHVFILAATLASCQGGPTGPAPRTFTLSSKSLVFANAVEETVTITNVTSDPIDWRVLGSTASWVNGTPTSGSLGPNSSNTFVVRINRNAVPNGTHTASLQIGAASYSEALDIRVEDGAPPKPSLVPGVVAMVPEQSTAVVEVVNSGGANLTWSLAGPSWMTATPSSGTLEAGGRKQVVVTVNRSNLTGGQYVATLQLSSNGGSASAQVTMEVEEISGLRSNPEALDFGSAATSLSLQVVNESDVTLAWAAKPSAAWISVSPSSGTLPPKLSLVLTVEVSRAGLSHGTNQAPLLLTTNRGSLPVTVLATVTPAGSPGPPSIVTPKMSVKPVALDFGGSATELSYTIHNDGDEPLDWTATTQSSWVSLPVRSGRVSPHSSAPVTVRVSRSGLTAGAYQSSIQFTSGDEALTVVVTATVGSSSTPPTTPPTTPPPTTPPPSGSAPAKISVSPTLLDFGTTETERSLVIQNTGGSALDWTAGLPSPWATLSANSGRIPTGSSQTLVVRVSRSGLLAAGTYETSVQVSSNGGAMNVGVSMEVPIGPAPPPLPPPPSGGDAVSVLDYGAKGDGAHDDRPAFQAAINALHAAGGGTLYVPAGTYVVTPVAGVPDRAIDLARRSNITIAGAGQSSTTIRMATGTYQGDTHIVFFLESSNITIRDLTLDGNRLKASFSDEQNHCTEVWRSWDIRFERVLFHFCRGDGIRFLAPPQDDAAWTERVMVRDSRFEDNGRSGIAISRGVRFLTILNNTFERITDQSIDIEPTGSRAPTDIRIEGNLIKHTTAAWAVAIGGIEEGDVAKRLVFLNNRIENGAVSFGKTDELQITGNTILGDAFHCALRLAKNVTNVIVEDNEISGRGGEAEGLVRIISLNGVYPSKVTIQNNRILPTGGQTGIFIRDALSDINIVDNEIVGIGVATGVSFSNLASLGTRPRFNVLDNVITNFTTAVRFTTQADKYSAVTIQSNTMSYTMSSSGPIIGILFEKTGPYGSFATVEPNTYGAGIDSPIVLLNQ